MTVQLSQSGATSQTPAPSTRYRPPPPPRSPGGIVFGSQAAVAAAGRSPASVSVEVEEYFQGVVEEVEREAIRIRTKSSRGEEGVAWLALDEIPAEEQKYIAVGAPMRVSVLVTTKGTRQRRSEIRFLRPTQWHRPSEAARERAADYLLDQMKTLLARSAVEGSSRRR